MATELGTAMRGIMENLTSQEIDKIILDTLEHDFPGVDLDPRNDRLNFSGALRSEINLPQARIDAPDWIDLNNYLFELKKLSSSYFWTRLLHAQESIPKVVSDMEGAHTTKAVHADLAVKIAQQNEGFYGLSIPLLGLAALFGTDLFAMFNPLPTESKHTSVNAVEVAAKQFGAKASSMDELIQRIETLFPAEAADMKPTSAYRLLKDNGAFVMIAGHRRVCPAIHSTQMLFQGFGRVFRDRYQTSFRQRVSK